MSGSKFLTRFSSMTRFFTSRRNTTHFSNVHDTVVSNPGAPWGGQWVTDFPLMIYQMSSDGVQALGEFTKKCAEFKIPPYPMTNGIIARGGGGGPF